MRKVVDFSLRNSSSQILSRNFSHNIGSHVMHNADMGKITAKLNNQNPRYATPADEINTHRYASALKSILDRYIVQRNEYLADVSESTMPAGNYAKFYAEVVMPFVENFLLSDNIAAAEGIGFPSPDKDNRLQIRVFVEDRELITLYDTYSDKGATKMLQDAPFRPGYPNIEDVRPDGETLHLPYRLPFASKGNSFEEDTLELINSKHLESFFHTKKIIARSTKTGKYFGFEGDAGDVEVALPGVLGRHAFYSMLENFVRNSAKHNKEALKKQNLVIEIRLSPLRDEDIADGRFANKHDAWRVTISDSGLSRLSLERLNKLNEYVNAPLIIGQTGEPRNTGLGIADMVVSASVLAGSFDFDFSDTKVRNKYLRIEETLENDGKYSFAYSFFLLKAKRIICLTRNSSSTNNDLDWRENGISFVRNVHEMLGQMGKQSFRFAVLDADLLDTEFGDDTLKYENLLQRLPFRVIVKENPCDDCAGKYWRKLAEQRRVVIYRGNISCETPDAFLRFCWEQWLLLFYPQLKTGNHLPLQLHLYLEHEHPNWNGAAKLDYGGLLNLNVYTPNRSDFQYREGTTNLIYDHHGRLLQSMKGRADFLENDSYTIFDKNSSDFPRLIYPDENTLSVLPYMMAEAGLMRILVMDERVAERADFDADMEGRHLGDADPKFRKTSTASNSLNDKVFELAWAGGVHIATHYQINDGPFQPLNDKNPLRENAPQLTLHIQTETPGRAGKISVSSNLRRSDGSEYHVESGHYDMLLIHRTILKHIQESVRKIEEQTSQIEGPGFDFLRDIKTVIPFTVVDSGGGYPDEIRKDYKGSFKFLPFSFMSEHLLRDRIAKVGLSQLLMGLADAKHE